MTRLNLTVNPVVSISQLKQNSQQVIDWLTNNNQSIILIQGSIPVGIISPYNGQNFSSEAIALRKKKIDQIENEIKNIWKDTNLSVPFDPTEVDAFTFDNKFDL